MPRNRNKQSSDQEINDELRIEPKTDSEPQQQKKVNEDTSEKMHTEISRKDLFMDIFVGFGSEGTNEQKKTANETVSRYLRQVIDAHEISKGYNVVVFYDETRMVQSDADNIYSAVTKFEKRKPILLILHSTGGFVGPAYLIGKMLYEYSGGKLDIAVPRRAKSAATLLCCAADHIHMGSLSELGPIDPQFEGLPALGLKSSIEHIAALIAQYPHATDLFAKYMIQAIRPVHLGYFERVAESATQYAERLLRPHKDQLKNPPEKIANDLVYSYKDHGFVIDKQEAASIFGDKVVKQNSEEYQLANVLYQELVMIGQIADVIDHDFYMIGSVSSEPGFLKRKK